MKLRFLLTVKKMFKTKIALQISGIVYQCPSCFSKNIHTPSEYAPFRKCDRCGITYKLK